MPVRVAHEHDDRGHRIRTHGTGSHITMHVEGARLWHSADPGPFVSITTQGLGSDPSRVVVVVVRRDPGVVARMGRTTGQLTACFPRRVNSPRSPVITPRLLCPALGWTGYAAMPGLSRGQRTTIRTADAGRDLVRPLPRQLLPLPVPVNGGMKLLGVQRRPDLLADHEVLGIMA